MAERIVITPADLDWARSAVDTARLLFPRHCAHGINTYRPDSELGVFDEELDQVVISRHWLEHFQHAGRPNPNHTSYGCKHFAENWSGRYVCNGALIAAAAGLGIDQKATDLGSPNTLLAIKYSSWTKGISWHWGTPAIESVERLEQEVANG